MKLISILNEGNISADIELFIKDLKHKKIIQKGYSSSTAVGSKGKNQLFISTGGMGYDEFTKLIKKYYKQTGTTNMASHVYYSPIGKLYFYYYPTDKGDFKMLIRRNNLK